MRYLKSALIICFVLFSFSAQAFRQLDPAHYIVPEEFSPQSLPKPAQETDPAWQKQIAMVVAAQKNIPESDKEAMEREAHASIVLMTTVMGDGFDEDGYPRTFALLNNVFNDTAIVTESAKAYWGTRRPYVAAPNKVQLLVEPVNNNAYPSGHTSLSYTLAEVLGMLYPDKRSILREQAKSVANHRIQAGVHYPQDIDGGRTLGKRVIAALLKNKVFQHDLALAKAEIKSHAQQ